MYSHVMRCYYVFLRHVKNRLDGFETVFYFLSYNLLSFVFPRWHSHLLPELICSSIFLQRFYVIDVTSLEVYDHHAL